MGQASVNRALDWLFAKPTLDSTRYEPRSMLFAGFAGALTATLRVGDVLVADEVVDTHGKSWRTTWPVGSCATTLHRGRLLTVDHLAATPEEKRRLGEQHQTCAVDMESATFAERCTNAGVPFTCVRAISDELATPLSLTLASLLSAGTASPWRLIKALALQPSLLPELLRLARDTKRAAEELGFALRELLAKR